MLEAALWQLPSTMARLAYIAGLRDPNTGVYHHRSVSNAAEKAEVDRLLQAIHNQAFRVWLNYRLEEQKADLDLYFSGLECGKATAVETWMRLESYRWFIPASATPAERQLFLTDLEVLLRLMCCGAPAPPGETASSDESLLSTGLVSRWLGISPRTLRLWAESTEIPAVKVGRQWRFRRRDIGAWLQRKRDD